jgi:DNA primase
VQLCLYRLPELLASGRDEAVFLCEGEKDADNLRQSGLTATTCPGGAGKWRVEYAESLRDRSVVLLPDNDRPGRAHAGKVFEGLRGVARSLKVLELPGLTDGGDVSDWFKQGGTKDYLLAMAREAPKGVFPGWFGEKAPEFEGRPRPLVSSLLPVPVLDPRLLPDC